MDKQKLIVYVLYCMLIFTPTGRPTIQSDIQIKKREIHTL
jgi:hypothetical protein